MAILLFVHELLENLLVAYRAGAPLVFEIAVAYQAGTPLVFEISVAYRFVVRHQYFCSSIYNFSRTYPWRTEIFVRH